MIKKLLLPALLANLLLASNASMALSMGDEEKLKELERAVNAPSASTQNGEGAAPTETLTKKKRTRAIVFDADPTTEQAPATVNPPVMNNTVAATRPARIQDCKAAPAPDARITPVDFSIQFKIGSAEIAPSSEDTLRQIAKVLALASDKCILVEGHTDGTGNSESNLLLSRDRANSVYRFIVDKAGIDTSRITAVGKGQNEPLKNLDPRDPKNRRVVFKVVG